MAVIIDASVALKWFLPEAGAETARAFLATGVELSAPDLLIAEVSNVLWLKVERGHVPQADAETIVRRLPDYFVQIIPARELAETAIRIAGQVHHSVYDCLYVAAADITGADLITADRGLITSLRHSVWASRVRLLTPEQP